MKKILFVLLLTIAPTLNSATVKENYQKHCIMCHGIDGKGQTKVGQKLDIKDHSVIAVKDADAFKAIKQGLKQGDRTLMKPYEVLSDEEIKEIIKYFKEFIRKNA